MQSCFRRGEYRGYEVRLQLKRRGRRYDPLEIVRPQDAYAFMRDLAKESAEFAYSLLLDEKHRVTDVYLVGKGGCKAALVDPKEVFKASLAVNSPAFVFVHNHPSGVVDPSAEDMALMRRLDEASSLLNISFLDSLIIGDGRYYSFQEHGLLGGR